MEENLKINSEQYEERHKNNKDRISDRIKNRGRREREIVE